MYDNWEIYVMITKKLNKNGHTWGWCGLCGISVKCGTCGDHSGNPALGQKEDGTDCEDCRETWEIQDNPTVEQAKAAIRYLNSMVNDIMGKPWDINKLVDTAEAMGKAEELKSIMDKNKADHETEQEERNKDFNEMLEGWDDKTRTSDQKNEEYYESQAKDLQNAIGEQEPQNKKWDDLTDHEKKSLIRALRESRVVRGIY